MWLTNYLNYLFASMMILLAPDDQRLTFPEYRKIDGRKVSTGTGSREGGNVKIDHSEYSHPLDAIVIGAVGSLSTPAASANYVYSQIIFGTGTTPVDESDYMLENMITSGLSFTISSAFDAESKVAITNLTVTCTDAAKDVSEIGMAYDQVLLFRKVLDAPIHLEVGDSFLVRIAVDIASGGLTMNV